MYWSKGKCLLVKETLKTPFCPWWSATLPGLLWVTVLNWVPSSREELHTCSSNSYLSKHRARGHRGDPVCKTQSLLCSRFCPIRDILAMYPHAHALCWMTFMCAAHSPWVVPGQAQLLPVWATPLFSSQCKKHTTKHKREWSCRNTLESAPFYHFTTSEALLSNT